jgi:hypothetical protein
MEIYDMFVSSRLIKHRNHFISENGEVLGGGVTVIKEPGTHVLGLIKD